MYTQTDMHLFQCIYVRIMNVHWVWPRRIITNRPLLSRGEQSFCKQRPIPTQIIHCEQLKQIIITRLDACVKLK